MDAQQIAAPAQPPAGPADRAGKPAAGTLSPVARGWRARLARVRDLHRTLWGYFPLTPVGLAIGATTLTAGWYQGIGHLDLIVIMVSFCALVALALVLLLVIIGFARVRGAFRHPIGRTCNVLEAESVSATGWSVRLPLWIPCVDVTWTWEAVPGACDARLTLHSEGRETYEMAVATRRGLFHRIVRRIQVRDILGLTCITWRVEEKVALEVLPHRGKVDQMVPLLGLISGDDVSDPYGDPWGDRVDMRQYSPGDSPRMIMWKVFARSRKLMVRIPERAVSARPRGCGYLIADTRSHPLDEASAGVARVLVERHLLGEGWAFAADQGGAPATTVDDALEVLARSGQATAGPSGIGDFLEKAQREGYGYCALFLPPRPGPWLDDLLTAVRRTHLRLHAFIGMDGVDTQLTAPAPRVAALRRFFVGPDALDAPTVPELTEVVTKLRSCSGEVAIIDRRTGQLYNQPLALLSRTEGMR